jgi:hypothetical protein
MFHFKLCGHFSDDFIDKLLAMSLCIVRGNPIKLNHLSNCLNTLNIVLSGNAMSNI